MKPYLYILSFALIFVFAFNIERTKPISKLLVGEWVLDSISGSFQKWAKDFVYITDKGELWKFTYDNDRYLIDSCLRISAQEVLLENKKNYHLELIDSFKMQMVDNFGNTFFYNKQDRKRSRNYKDNLKDFIIKDSLHQKVNGWWKLRGATFKPIQIFNYGNKINDFTIQLKKNGIVTIYIDNLVDSTMTFTWKTKPDKLTFQIGCIVGFESTIYYLDNNKMVTTLDNVKIDTLTFERCKPLTR